MCRWRREAGNASVCRRGHRSSGGRWRLGADLGAQVGYDLGDLTVLERFAEGRHFLAAVEDLFCDFRWWPGFVFADLDESGSLFCAHPTRTVAEGASFVAEEDGACLLILPGL